MLRRRMNFLEWLHTWFKPYVCHHLLEIPIFPSKTTIEFLQLFANIIAENLLVKSYEMSTYFALDFKQETGKP